MLAGCVDKETEDLRILEQGGLRVATNLRPPPDTVLLTQPVSTIGSVAGEVVFGEITQVGATPDGRIIISDSQDGIGIYNPDGTSALEIGRRGSGPGEFNAPYRFVLDGDSLWVWSLRPPLMSVFNVNGGFTATVPLTKTNAGLPFAPIGSGLLNEVEWGQLIDPGPAHGAIILVRDETVVDTIVGPYPVPEFGWIIVDDQSMIGRMVQPPVFTVRPQWALCQGTIVFGSPADASLDVYSLDGTQVGRILLDRDVSQIDRADREAYAAELIAAYGLQEDPGTLAANTEYTPTRPRLTGVVCGDNGDIWVADFSPRIPRPFDAVGHEWDVVDPNGRARARVVFPETFRLTEVRQGRAYGVRTTDTGAQVAEVYTVPPEV